MSFLHWIPKFNILYHNLASLQFKSQVIDFKANDLNATSTFLEETP